ncbi:MAG: hypothetical protein Q8P26_00875 [Candidatus Levybacteria bacterium]|nr:hypothetical protein [Candidatus Levybacteria bacterium]
MGPNGVGQSSSGQGQPSVGVMESPVNPVTPIEANPNPASNPLSGLENAINAAKEALGQTESPAPQATATQPIAEPVMPQSPTEQFQNTFGDAIPQASQAPSEAVPAAPAEPVQAPVENTATESVAKPATQTQEAQPQAEVKLPPQVQEFLDSVLSAVDKYKTAEESKAVTP